MKVQARLVAAVLLATPPAAALAAPGMITTSVDLRAGPSVEFPVVNRLPSGAPVEIHGCIRQALWCDVSWGPERGWVVAQYLDYFYDGRYVDLRSYVVDVPAASFVLTSYWSSYYFGRPWYRRHAWWNRHWTTQPHVVSQAPATQPAAASAQAAHGKPPAGIAMTPPGAAMGRGPNAAPTVASGQAMGAQAMQPPTGRLVPAAGARDRLSGMRSAMTARASGSATAVRGGVMPMAAHAQFGGSRGGIGGAPQAGGPRDNGGRRRH